MSEPLHQPYSGPKRLVRNSDRAWIAGVCAGVADYTGLDANLVRVLVAIGALFSFGTLLIAYVIAWVLMPTY